MIRHVNIEPAEAYASWQHVARHSGIGDAMSEPLFVAEDGNGHVLMLIDGAFWSPIPGGAQRIYDQQAASGRDDFVEQTTYRHGVEVSRTIRPADWFA